MVNKKIGDAFETETVEFLAEHGCWARKMFPDEAGNQPFDVLAIRGDIVYAYDCKTCCRPKFPLSRWEFNQQLGMESLYWKSNPDKTVIGVLCKHNDEVYFISYPELVYVRDALGEKEVKLDESHRWKFDCN